MVGWGVRWGWRERERGVGWMQLRWGVWGAVRGVWGWQRVVGGALLLIPQQQRAVMVERAWG